MKEKRGPKVVNSRDVPEYIQNSKKVLITGPNDSGKTALLKTLFTEPGAELVPLMISGKEFTGRVSESRFRKVISTAIERQYDPESVERYLQLDPARKLLLLDDYHQASPSRPSQTRLLEFATNMFGHVVFTVPDFYPIQALTREGLEDNPFRDFDICEIREFGHRLRGRLINKWLTLGRDTASELMAIEHETRTTEKVITTLLGKNLVPSFPINVLSLLHTLESAQPHATTDASFGSIYETLIKANLRFSSSGGSDDAELKFTYTSVIAFAIFEKEQSSLGETDLRKLHDEYTKTFAISPNFKQILADLVEANVLVNETGQYSFKYNHVYYYCVAKYLERGLKRKDAKAVSLRARVEYMADRLHSEELANIVLFYLYLTHDWELTQRILSNADRVYIDKRPSTLTDDVEFVNKIYKEPSKMLIEDSDVERHREEHRKRMDEAEESGQEPPSLDAKLTYQDTLADIYKINIAFKTMQVLGQVLRSSVASMEGDVKLQILRTVYMLGLRTMRAILNVAQENVVGIRLYLSGLIRERAALLDKHLSESELLTVTDEGVIWMTLACAYGSIKKVSFAVGHHHLEDVCEQVLEEHGDNTAIRLVDLAIKFDHFATVPMSEVIGLRDRVVGNLFTYTLLRQFVGDFLYLYRTDARTGQRLGALFKIEGATSPKFLLPDSKKN